MESSEIHEFVERVEHVEHEAHARVRTVVTILIPLVTVLTAVTALLAGRANGNAAEAQRMRTIHTVQAQQEGQAAAEQIGRYDDLNAAAYDAERRSTTEYRQVAQASGAAAAALTRSAKNWADTEDYYNKKTSTFNLADLGVAGVEAQQHAFAEGRAADGWINKEDANVGLAGLFAVALFLLGLTLTVPRPSVKWGFVGVASLLGVIGVGRMAFINLSGVHETPHAAITAYTEGQLAVQKQLSGFSKAAAADFQKATSHDPEYAEAWVALGDDYNAYPATRARLEQAVKDYDKAVDLGSKTALVYNNRGYAEMLLGRDAAARADIAAAHRLSPDNPFIDMSEAEAALSAQDLPRAEHWRDEAVRVLSGVDSSFRNAFFGQLRQQDEKQLATRLSPGTIAEFFLPLRDVEASLDAFHSATPRPTHGATLSDLTAAYDKADAFYRLSYLATGLRSSDVVSARVYDTSDESYSLYSSLPATSPGSGTGTVTFRTPIDAGTYRVELYLNGHYQTETTVRSPGD